jgi:hypothetical protein
MIAGQQLRHPDRDMIAGMTWQVAPITGVSHYWQRLPRSSWLLHLYSTHGGRTSSEVPTATAVTGND